MAGLSKLPAVYRHGFVLGNDSTTDLIEWIAVSLS